MNHSLNYILENYPVGLVNKLRRPVYEVGQLTGMAVLRGLADEMPWAKGVSDAQLEEQGLVRYGMALSLECDNLGETLVHEALHCKYWHMDEDNIDVLTEVYWNKYPITRKLAQARVVYELGRKGL